MADAAAESIKRRHIERQKKRIRQMKRRRIITISLLILILLLIIIFFTPLFNIRKTEVVGNVKVTALEIENNLDNAVGKNIFRYRTGTPVKNIKSIPYINDAEIKKSVFSGKITVNVSECVPVAYVEYGNKFVVIDSNLKVLEVTDAVEGNIPKLSDVEAVDINPGSKITFQTDGVLEAVATSISAISKEGLLEGIEYISFKDINNITFNYQERLDVVCGNSANFEKKIKLFNQAINTKTLTENSRGTIDLSVSGHAVYTP